MCLSVTVQGWRTYSLRSRCAFLFGENMTKEELIKIYRDKMPKRNWTENKDIYEVIDGRLCVWGMNGMFFRMTYDTDRDWNIIMFSRDIYGKREWMGYGKGWVDV